MLGPSALFSSSACCRTELRPRENLWPAVGPPDALGLSGNWAALVLAQARGGAATKAFYVKLGGLGGHLVQRVEGVAGGVYSADGLAHQFQFALDALAH